MAPTVHLNLPQQKWLGLIKTYCFEEFREQHPQAMEKSKQVQPLWSSHRYLYCTHLPTNQVTSVFLPKSHFATKEILILKCAVTTSVSSTSLPEDSPFQGCPQNAPLLMGSSNSLLQGGSVAHLTDTLSILHTTGFCGFFWRGVPLIDCIQP